MKKFNGKILAVDVAECAIFVALMVAAAFVKIPFPFVPLTFQTAISVLAGLLLGWKKGAASTAVYCIMGLIGIPVFTSGGGIFYVLKPTFGYILGFILSAVVGGLIAGKAKLPLWRYIVGAIAACLADYLIGIPYSLVAGHILGFDLIEVLVSWGLIFIPKDVVLSVIAALIAWRAAPAINSLRNRKPKEKEDSK